MGQQQQIRFDRLGLEDGLSQVSVNAIHQDSRGLIWIGTRDGLNRYDGYAFRIYRRHPSDADSISGNWIQAITEDANGDLWIGTAHDGLNHFDMDQERFTTYKSDRADPTTLSHNNVYALTFDARGRLWVGLVDGGLNLMDRETGAFTHYRADGAPYHLSNDQINVLYAEESDGTVLWVGTRNGLNKLRPDSEEPTRFERFSAEYDGLAGDQILSIFRDQAGTLWIGTDGGLCFYNEEERRFELYDFGIEISRNPLVVFAMEQDANGYIWAGSDDSGLVRFHPKDTQVTIHKNAPIHAHSLSNNTVNDLLLDRTGVMWIGTSGSGINKCQAIQNFELYINTPDDPQSLSASGVASILVDSRGTLWVGSWETGLNRMDQSENGFRHYRHTEEAGSLGSDLVVAPLYEDRSGQIWVGHRGGLDMYDASTDRFVHYPKEFSDGNRYQDSPIGDILEDRLGRLWIGGQDGLSLLDRTNGEYQTWRRDPNQIDSLPSNRIRDLAEDKAGGLWIATFGGGLAYRMPDSGRFISYKEESGLSSNQLICLSLSENGLLWIGGLEGLNRLHPERGEVTVFDDADGLDANVIYAIIEDESGHLWLSTNKGIAQFNPESGIFRPYGIRDGLQSNEFNQRAATKAADGKLYFGGTDGFNAFYPGSIKQNIDAPSVIISEFLLYNKPAQLRRLDPASPLLTSAVNLTEVILNHKQRFFGFEFAALHYTDPNRNQYAYKLDGLDQDWIYTDATRRFASYPNARPGDYTFRLKAANKDGVWSEQEVRVAVIVKPALWLTWWAITFYIMAMIGLIAYIIRIREQRYERETQLEQERINTQREQMVARQLRQIDKIKDEFLANTSHELRTPLNGIIGLAEALADGLTGPLPEPTVQNLNLIVDSAKRLSDLVNDILDFAKLKNRSLELQITNVNIKHLVDTVFQLSAHLIGPKQIKLVNAIADSAPMVEADKNRLQQIMFNLVSNAIKFTNEGTVTVSLEVSDDSVTISVKDTGIGLPKDKWDVIFDSFEQGEGSVARAHGGSGLGLAITRQLVSLHGGRIWLNSTINVGSTFHFTMPFTRGGVTSLPQESRTVSKVLNVAPVEGEITEPLQPVPGEFHILVVDDEPVNRQVVANHLKPWDYRVSEAMGGPEALQMVEEEGPFDLVMLDIMMPRMSGYEVCSRLRKQYTMTELPIIFMTAKNQVSDLVDGFVSGANDYITKPIAKYELLSRIKTQLLLLDIHRNLELKVQERTLELEQRNHEILRRQDQLILQEKMASLGTLTAGVAHEIKNPLNFINNFSQLSHGMFTELRDILIDHKDLFADDPYDELEELIADLQKNVNSINEHGGRANQIIHGMMEMISGDSSKPILTNLNGMVEKFIKLAYHGARAKRPGVSITVQRDYDKFLGDIELSQRSLGRALINLMNNALEAVTEKSEEDPAFTPTILIKTRGVDDGVEIIIRDNGPGINSNVIKHIFSPFFTTKPPGSDHIGLGLYVSYEIIVSEHHGRLTIESEEGVFTQVNIYMPVRQ